MAIFLLDGTMKVEIFFDDRDVEFTDNICVSFVEDCPDEEKVFYAGETNLYLTPEQACQLAAALQAAARQSKAGCSTDEEDGLGG
jgi:hypothetical protein